MTVAAPQAKPKRPVGLGMTVGIVGGGIIAFGLIMLVANAYATCDVGVNANANGITLLFLGLPAAWAMNTVVGTTVFVLVAGRQPQRLALAAATTLLALLLVSWGLFAWQGTPSDYPSPFCDNNIPPWWPGWIPA